MLWGYFKKIVVADSMAVYVDTVYGNLDGSAGFALIAASFFFTIQIYCDFSGYSDIAVGTARLFGIRLMKNFDAPYFSTSLKEFWSRWHISLSTWFRDYVYIPLGGNRCAKGRQRFNLLVTFLISGLWHGANWTYVVWGGLHGAGQVLENLFFSPLQTLKKCKAGRFLSWLAVFLFCNITWIFFRAESLHDAAYVLSHWAVGILSPRDYLAHGLIAMGMGSLYIKKLMRVGISLFILLFGEMALKEHWIRRFNLWAKPVRWGVYILFVWLILILLPPAGGGEFIYFQF